MSRKTRTLQFFATPEEGSALLKQFESLEFHIYEVVDGRTTSFDTSSGPPSARTRLFIGEEQAGSLEAHRCPAKWGLVMFDFPFVSEGSLEMSVFGAVNAWTDQAGGFIDDQALRFFDRLKRLVADRFVGSVDIDSLEGGHLRHYPRVRTTGAAVAMWEKGFRFVQPDVPMVSMRPHGR